MSLSCLSQVDSFNGYSYKFPEAKQVLSAYDLKLKNSISSIEEHKSDYKEIFENSTILLKDNISNNLYIHEQKLVDYFDSILKELCAKNKGLNYDNFNLFISRYPWGNASCYYEGTIVFQLGLYRKLESESQIAFVLAHELAHYYFKHGINSINKYVQEINSTEFKKEVKEIKNMEYNSRKRAVELIKGITYSSRRHGRNHESQADSMALIFLANTKYDVHNGIKAIELLDSIDTDKYTVKIKYDSIFNFTNYPFKKRWLIDDNVSIFGDPTEDNIDEFDLDSLKTHPDCKIRYTQLKQLCSSYSKEGEINPQGENKLKTLRAEADFELLHSYYSLNYSSIRALDKALFYSLKLLYLYPDNAYINQLVGNCFYVFYNAQNSYKLNNYVESKGHYNSDQYDEFLLVIKNFSLNDYRNIGFHYMESKYPQFKDNENYLYQLVLNASILEDQESFNSYALKYSINFPDGKYSEEIKQISEQNINK